MTGTQPPASGTAGGMPTLAAPGPLRAAGRRLDTGGHHLVTLVREPNGSWRLHAGPRGVRLEAGVMVALCQAVLHCARQGGTR